jgi:hypothetical protein
MTMAEESADAVEIDAGFEHVRGEGVSYAEHGIGDIRSPLVCSKAATTFVPFRSCWVIRMWPRR